ncbi:hypothetical protein QUH73_09685 [Labilibaculum sp. K2S]|uniref:hypothetical protein n=1 Tax=Labilibaculum sp. K2S TaxID=3056386 RepID=UPI0025A46AC2|nr:hypothetical protein [Labilibaculum sp. K2S]MDM8160082.1 hypothetical protein [Labilibaculum sp. K2S]
MNEEQIEYKTKNRIRSIIQSIYLWKGSKKTSGLLTIIIAALSLWIAYKALQVSNESYRYSVEANRPQIAIADRGGNKAITNEHYCVQTSKPFLYKIPILQIHTKNTGLRSLTNFTITTTGIYPKSKTIFKGDPLGSPNPFSAGAVWYNNLHPPVPILDSTNFFLFVKFNWEDPLLNETDSLKLYYHCVFNEKNNSFDINGIDNIQVENITKDIESRKYEEFETTTEMIQIIQNTYITP